MSSIHEQFAEAMKLHQSGGLEEAEGMYRQILARQPQNADALHLLGVIAGQTGRAVLAMELIQAAISLDEGVAEYHFNLGQAYMAAKSPEKAADAFERANALRRDHPEILLALAMCRCDQNLFERAIEPYRAALRIQPERADLHANLGIALRKIGHLDESLKSFEKSLALEPRRGDVWMEQGISLAELGRLEEAMESFQRALSLLPNDPRIYFNIGTTFFKWDRPDEAIEAFSRAIQLRPNYLAPYNNLANSLTRAGEVGQAVAVLDRLIELDPADQSAHSNRLYYLHFHPDYDAAKIRGELERWNSRNAFGLMKDVRPYKNERSAERRLRVGYVSPDFYGQAESHFTVPLLESHDHEAIEVYCYASVKKEDQITERLRRSADVWRDTKDASDADLAEVIRGDRVDILVDLTMHMGHNRLMVFAGKPAPVQVTWLAYPGSTGLTAMDYRLTDGWMDPVGRDECYCEESVRLPKCWCCYDPLSDMMFASERAAGPIRFGSLNNPCKFNEKTIRLWAEVMARVPGSQLFLLNSSVSQQRTITQWLGESGNRVFFFKPMSRPAYLQFHDGIDMALDPLPYNGITTTCDALWMGVPVVSLIGQTAAGRAGLSILSTIGLPELVAASESEFIRVAVELANDRERLAELRRSLRHRMGESALMNGKRFARDVEAAYRQMWIRWVGR